MDVIDVLGEILADIEKQSADASKTLQNKTSKQSINPSNGNSTTTTTTSTTTTTTSIEQQSNNSASQQQNHHQAKSVRFTQNDDQERSTKEPSKSPIPPPLPPPPSNNKLLQAPHHQPLQIVVDTLQVPGDRSFLHSPSRDILAGNNGAITPVVVRTPSPRGDFGQKSPTVLTRTTTGGWAASPKVTDASEGVPVFSINDDNEDWNFQSYHLDYKYTPPPIKGPCCVCGDGIMGAMVTALDKMWHPEHFCCVHCGKELRSPNYTEHGSQPYCKPCHNMLFLPPCAGCNKDILQGHYIQPMGKVFHPNCFRCQHCVRVLSPDDFYERDGKVYCDECRHELFSPKCHNQGCRKPIKDERKVTALGGKTWHPTCFKCTKCHSVMNPNNFRERESKLYCEPCFNDLFMPKCGTCNTPIVLEKPTIAMGRTYHSHCFTCKDCKKILSPDNFLEKNNRSYCDDCYHNRFSEKCAGCKKPIKDPKRKIIAQGKAWHPEHFTCVECHKQLDPNNFWEKEGLPYCEDDFHRLFSPKCAGCWQPIKVPIQKVLFALGKNWHVDHFCCCICGKTLSENEFYEKDGKAYCVDDYLRLFAPHCKQCRAPITDNYCLTALGGDWHANCFRCRDCNCLLEDVNFFEINGEPYCEQHFHARQCPDCIRIRRAQNRYFGIPEDTPMQVKKWASTVSLKSLELNQRPLSQISQHSYSSSNNFDNRRGTPTTNQSQRSSYIGGGASSSLFNKDNVHHIHDQNGICLHDQLVEEIQQSISKLSTSKPTLTAEQEARMSALGGKSKGWKKSQDNMQFIAKNQSPYVYNEPGKFPVLEPEKHIRFEEVELMTKP